MKLTGKLRPKNLFRSKNRRSESSSSSSDSSITTSSASPKSTGTTTPTTVLPTQSETSGDVQYELLQAFRIIDTDGDGRITRSELESLLNRIGGSEPVSSEEIRLMINEIDADGDGSISLQEFGVMRSVFGPPSCDGELRGAFEFFDRDHDGMITAEELFAVFEVIGDGRCTLEECRRMISSVDENGDGFVCFEDFRRMMHQQTDIELEAHETYCTI